MKNKCSVYLNSPRGYTIVELLIIITITGLLVTFGLSAYSKSQERQTALAAKESIIALFQEAQKQATIGDKDCSGLYLGESLTISSGSSDIITTSTCELETGTPRTTTLPNIIFTDTHTITFQPLGTGVDLGGPESLNLDYTIDGTTYEINLTSPGVITYVGAI